MVDTMRVYEENMSRAAAKGFINATDCADFLTKKGLPFRDAYKITGQIVAYCIEQNKTLETLSLDEYKGFSQAFDQDIFKAVDLNTCVQGAFLRGPSRQSVEKQIELAKKALQQGE